MDDNGHILTQYRDFSVDRRNRDVSKAVNKLSYGHTSKFLSEKKTEQSGAGSDMTSIII